MKNAIITGLPRSGTTLVCHLLNKLDNIAALHEPLNISLLDGADRDKVKEVLDSFFVEQRMLIQSQGVATSKSHAGHVPSNHLSNGSNGSGRVSIIDRHFIKVSNINNSHFSVYVKHPVLFTAMLPLLEDLYPCYINIRNPLAVILSWRATSFPVSRGRAPAAEMINEELKHRLDHESDILMRQLILLDFFFSQYDERKSSVIVRYEDVVSTCGRILAALDPSASRLNQCLNSQNNLYIDKDPGAKIIAEKLLESPNSCWNFYSKDEVARLANL
jgi:hypothetical protein